MCRVSLNPPGNPSSMVCLISFLHYFSLFFFFLFFFSSFSFSLSFSFSSFRFLLFSSLLFSLSLFLSFSLSLFLSFSLSLCVQRTAFCVLRSTFHVPRSAFCVLRSAFHVPRSTFHVLRFAFYVLRSTFCFVHFTFHFMFLRTRSSKLRQAGHDLLVTPHSTRCHLSIFFLPLKLGGLGGLCSPPWRAWKSVIPTLMATTQSPDTDTLFNAAPRLRAQLAQLQATLSLPMNRARFPLKTTWRSPSPNNQPHRRSKTSTSNFLTASLTNLLNAPCSYHNPPHTPVHTSCSPAVKRTKLRIAAFRVSVARRLMLPHPAAPNAADVVQSCPNKSATGLICNKPVDTAAPLGTEEVLIAGMQQWSDV